ncbi:MAG TPA: hypothetical protein VM934_14605 [Pyrinomonadaceae bacterium]|nr:hypothetical protein [Pyrinomonadaceae bacterium]
MKEHNDFFDDLIDDEAELDEATFLGSDDEEGEDEDDEDEFAEVRTAVMSKNGMIALLSLKRTPTGAQIVRLDPRESVPTAQRYDDSDAAELWFKRSLATSKKNGWSVAYDGEPLFG